MYMIYKMTNHSCYLTIMKQYNETNWISRLIIKTFLSQAFQKQTEKNQLQKSL